MPSPSSIIDKIVRAGDPGRKSRLHTLCGDRAPLSSLADFPQCLGHALSLRLFGRRPLLPWIPYPAIRFLRRRFNGNWHVLEIGSGMSTLWLASHCAQVESIEADQRCVDLLQAEIARRRIPNVHLFFRWLADEMCDFSQWPDASFDLAFVDGGPRTECFINALPKVKSGGYVYVDNTDIAKTSGRSRELLLAYAREHRCQTWIFRGFAPCNLFIDEGILLQKNP
jgi:Methyltransferase domain